MKLYIIGAVASGKSTLARRVAERTGVPCTHLDDVVYMPDPAAPEGNRKRPAEERDRLFQEVLAQKSYIIEDAGRTCFLEGLRQADTVVLLDPPIAVRRRRILTRWVKQNLGLEPCGYRPNFAMVRAMFPGFAWQEASTLALIQYGSRHAWTALLLGLLAAVNPFARRWRTLEARSAAWTVAGYGATLALLALCVLAVAAGSFQPFLYQQF